MDKERTLALWMRVKGRLSLPWLALPDDAQAGGELPGVDPGIASNGAGPGVKPAIAAAIPPCPYLLPPTGELVQCPDCTRAVRLRVMGCSILGKCVPSVSVNGYGFCGRCPHRPSPPAVSIDSRD